MFCRSNRLGFILMAFFIMAICTQGHCQNNASIQGNWTIFSYENNMPRAIIKLSKVDGEIEGVIERFYYNSDDYEICAFCKGELKNKPIIGLRVLWGMEDDGGGYWSGGHVLDPQTGESYKCKMHLEANGKKLVVRAYRFIPWIGKTMNWVRRTES
jgi:uncharacterized protein (DUF2147 family)